MKKIYILLSATFVFATYSCEKSSELSVKPGISRAEGVDLTTPHDAQPYIVNEYGLKGAPSDYKLIWSDEFDGKKGDPDSKKWTEQNSSKSRSLGSRDPELKWWGWKGGNCWKENGNLILRSFKKNETTLLCGSANTNNKFEFKYGYIEARISIQDPKYGSHTALWLQGDNMGKVNGNGHDGAEIDVFESVWTNDYTKSVVHYDGYGKDHRSKTKGWSAPNMKSGYHLYALSWSKWQMRVYYDGDFKVEFGGIHVPQTEEYLWLSNGASFNFKDRYSGAKGFSTRSVGSKYKSYVDYIRVWQEKKKD